MSTEQSKAIGQQFVAGFFNQGNMGLADELLAQDFVDHDNLPPGVPNDREGTKMLTTALRRAFPDFHATIEDIVAEGDKVVIRMTWSGTQKGEFMGVPASGKQMSVEVIDIMRVAGGKIVDHWGLLDSMGMMQQLGVIPTP